MHAPLFRIAERHAATEEQRQIHPSMIGPHQAIRLVSFLLSGTAKLDEGEPEVDHAALTAVLSLARSSAESSRRSRPRSCRWRPAAA
ncbi:hypothetical protein [Nonomuraea endophytica]|uniref:Uncharacterized protein n=1 Tax=Nonomuraea endophytica TaxID=714136 RepID=A0A7W8A8I1_9ACTN|nr:hypothetical protein [Nonomuraea endophytica]MBB5081523.1 hypothetical protein [Nonomuraea endophytica]